MTTIDTAVDNQKQKASIDLHEDFPVIQILRGSVVSIGCTTAVIHNRNKIMYLGSGHFYRFT